MKHIQVGMTVKAGQLIGEVVEILTSARLRDPNPTEYYRIKLHKPDKWSGEFRVIRLDNVRSATWRKSRKPQASQKTNSKN